MGNPHLLAALEKHQEQIKQISYRGSKRDYFLVNVKTILELVAAGVPQDEILKAFEADGMKMSKRYFSNMLNEVRQHGGLLESFHRNVPDI